MKTTDNIYSNKKICDFLSIQCNEGKVSHAYLFCGPYGCGKLSCAKQFAKQILGNNKFDYSIDNQTHPDVKIYEPKGINSYLTAQISEIIKDSYLAPIQANYKIYIIKQADKLGSSAANAFLKTLEEPPKNVCFILLVKSIDSVLPTIVSRCQVYHFNQVAKDEQINYVSKNSGCSYEDAEYVVDLFGGDLEKSVHFCLNQDLQDFVSLLDDVISSLDNMTDWQALQQSNLINQKIKSIVDRYKESLDNKLEEISEILENSAISILEDQNKRSVSAKNVELYYLLCSYFQQFFKQKLLDETTQDIFIKRINLISKMSDNLSYNINKQNFCDVMLLNLKRVK